MGRVHTRDRVYGTKGAASDDGVSCARQLRTSLGRGDPSTYTHAVRFSAAQCGGAKSLHT
jgi:hypothetical protein